MPIFLRILVSNGLNQSIASFQKCKKDIFQRFLFILKQHRQKKANPKFYHCIDSSLRLRSLWTAAGVVGAAIPIVETLRWTLKKAKQFQRKLNGLSQDVPLAIKFCLTFQIQDFQVSFFVVSKWTSSGCYLGL